MKTSLSSTFVAGLLMAGITGSLTAAPIAGSNLSREYAIGVYELALWSAGVSYQSITRDASVSGLPGVIEMDAKRLQTYIGYDLFSWLTIFGSIGTVEASFFNDNGGDSELEWGGGVQFNIIDQEIMDPTLMENRLRLNANAQYTVTQSELGSGRDVQWEELHVALVASIVNDISGNKFFGPDSIGIFAGPVYSDLMGDVEEKDKVGYTAGLQFFCTKRVTLEVSMEDIGQTSVMGAVQVRF